MKRIILLITILSAIAIKNQAQNTWVQKADFEGSARTHAVGFSTTGRTIFSFKKDLWEYDVVANTWTQKANFGGNARSYATGFSIGSKGYIGTGYYLDFYAEYYLKDFWEYDPDANLWTQKADFGGNARYGATGFSIDGLAATLQNAHAQINTINLPDGFYTLQITNNKTGLCQVHKFVKQ